MAGFPLLKGVVDAQELYRKGCYKEAKSRFEAIEPKTSNVWYNIGNCAYKCGDIESALVSWERAIQLHPTMEQSDSYHNIRFVSNKNGVVYDMRRSWLDRLLIFFPLGVWQILFLIVWYLLSFLIFIRYDKRVQIIGLCVGALMVGYCVTGAYQMNKCVLARVKTKDSPLFVAPNDKVHAIAQLGYLAPLTVLATKDSWYKVQAGREKGWISMENVIII